MSKSDNLKLILGDCLKKIKQIPTESIDLVLTDPPFGISRKSNIHTMKDRLYRTGIDFGNWDNGETIKKVLPEIERVLKPKGAMLCFYDQMKLNEISFVLKPRRVIYWKKTNPMPMNQNPFPLSAVECILYSTKAKTGTYNGKGEHNWFQCHSPLPFERIHPTQKPLELIEWLIKLFSNEKETILDPFMGSGTTGAAAIKLKRKFIGIELEKKYYSAAKERIKKYKGVI